MLAAVSVLLVLLGNFLPLVGPLLLFAWPLPVVLIYLRHGGRMAILTVVVTGLLLTVFVGPMGALLQTLSFAMLGLGLGWAQRQRLDAASSVAVGTVAVLAFFFASLALLRFVVGENALAQMQNVIRNGMQQALDLYRHAGMNPQALSQLQQAIHTYQGLLPVVLPAMILFFAVGYALLAFLVMRPVLKRLDHPVADLPPFAEWQVPAWAALGWFGGEVCLLVAQRGGGGVWQQVGMNLGSLFQMLYLVGGLAFVYFLARHFRVARWLSVVILALFVVNPFLNEIVVWAGLFDSLFRYRRLLKQRWEGTS